MNVLFLCTGNSARSQMSEGMARALGNGRYQFHSAGTFPSREVHPLAIRAMEEIGIDIREHKTKLFTAVPKDLHFIVSVCGKAAEECPVIPGVKPEAWDLEDPAAATGTDEEKMAVFRRVRDEIRARVEGWLARHEGR